MRSWIGRLAVSGLVVLSVGAQADLVNKDSSFGANTLILDTDSGLQWLRMDVTYGMSFMDVASQFDAGEMFAGMRVASIGEVSTVFTRERGFTGNGGAFPSAPPTGAQSAAVIDVLQRFGGFVDGAGLWRVEGSTSNSPYGCSICYDDGYRRGFIATNGGNDGWGYTIDDSTRLFGAAARREGTWLVSSVPEPSTYALLGLGLLGLAWRRRSTRAE